MIFFLSISAYIHLQIRREECSVFYSMVAFVLVPGLVGLLCTHVHACAAHALFHTLVFPLLFPFSLILQLQVHSQFPASCVSVFVPRTYTIKAWAVLWPSSYNDFDCARRVHLFRRPSCQAREEKGKFSPTANSLRRRLQ